MGGDGSGRKPDVLKMAREQFQNSSVEFNEVPLVMPNYSGVQKEALRTGTGLTAGSVLFADADGTITQDNSNLFWDDANNRLGIGTASPSVSLDVNGDVRVRENGAVPRIFFQRSSADSPWGTLQWKGNTGTVKWEIASNQAVGPDIEFNEGDSVNTRMIIKAGGNVGIGATSPSQKLQVVGGTFGVFSNSTSGGATIQGDAQTGITSIYSDYLGGTEPKLHLSTFSDAGTADGITIDTAGKVGIGTVSPGEKLTIEGTAPIVEIRTGGHIMLRPTANDYDWRIHATGQSIQFVEAGTTPRVFFQAGGNVGIGTTTPAKLFHLSGSAAVSIIEASTLGPALLFNDTRATTREWSMQPSETKYQAEGIADTFSLSSKSYDKTIMTWLSGSAAAMPNFTGAASPTLILESLSGSFFISGGAFWYKGSTGTITKIANA